jgi:hypothetical protein
MLQALKKLIAEVADGDHHPDRFAEDDYRLAAAALLVHTGNIDGNLGERERKRLRTIIQQNSIWTTRRPTNCSPRRSTSSATPSIFIISPPSSTAPSTRRAARAWWR